LVRFVFITTSYRDILNKADSWELSSAADVVTNPAICLSPSALALLLCCNRRGTAMFSFCFVFSQVAALVCLACLFAL